MTKLRPLLCLFAFATVACASQTPNGGGGSEPSGTGGATSTGGRSGSGGGTSTGGSSGSGGSTGSGGQGSGTGGSSTGGASGTGGAGGATGTGGGGAADAAAETGGGGDVGGGDAPAVGEGGAGIVVGVRTSLAPLLASKWVGERKSMKEEDGVTVFTGRFNAGQIGGPNGNNVRLDLKPGKEYIFEYKIRFDANFDFSRGGKIPGLAGGTAPTGCVNVTAAGFSARMMWRENGKLIGYIYDQTQSSACGNGIQTNYSFKINTWASMKERVRINTGTAGDGILQIWADGNMVINRSNMKYMATQQNTIGSVLFHSFFGGSTQDWAPSRNVTISFSEPYVTLVE